jgi:predicted Ser/Thr protein kinase
MDRELYEFLAPPQGPGEVGRLGGYAVLKVLGMGGMGVVFRARDPQLARPVALKAMLPALATSPAARERFLREARAAAAVKHDHVVTIYQVGEDRGVPFLAMEFLEGESLQDCLKRERRLPVSEVLRIGREVAAGLAAAHRQGLLHRDIKPANLWLEAETRRVKIRDFGLAWAADGNTHLTQTGAVVGTPLYMAPEQAQGEALDERCDLFSLGCVLYRLCTGQLPFKGANTMAILRAIAVGQPTPPGRLNPDVPVALNDLILRLLARDRVERPASAAEVIRALATIERQVAGERTQPVAIPVAEAGRPMAIPVSAAAPLPPTILATPRGGLDWRALARRRPLWLAAAGGLVLLLGGVLVLAWPRGSGSSAPVAGAAASGDDGGNPGTGGGTALRPARGNKPPPIQAERAVPNPQFIRQYVRHTEGVIKVAYAADGQRFASISPKEVLTWDVEKGEKALSRARLPDGPWPVFTALTVAADGGTALLGVSDRGQQRDLVWLWDLKENKTLAEFPRANSTITDVCFSPDGTKVLASDSSITYLWDFANRQQLHRFQGSHACFAPDGRTIFTGKGTFLMVCDANTYQEVPFPLPAQVTGLACRRDRRHLFLALDDNSIRRWDADDHKAIRSFVGHKDHITSLAVSPDGRRLLSGSYDQTIRLWDVAKGKELHCFEGHEGHLGAVTCVTFSPSGRRALSASADQTIRLWGLPE